MKKTVYKYDEFTMKEHFWFSFFLGLVFAFIIILPLGVLLKLSAIEIIILPFIITLISSVLFVLQKAFYVKKITEHEIR